MYNYLSSQCILLGVRTMHVIIRYVIHLYDTRGAGTSAQRSWDKRGPLTYYTDLTSELIVLAVDFLHHVHMLLWSNIFLSMASLVICMQLRYLFYEIQRRITKHRNYLAVLNHMEQKYVVYRLYKKNPWFARYSSFNMSLWTGLKLYPTLDFSRFKGIHV